MGAPGTTEGPLTVIKGSEDGDEHRCAIVAQRGKLAYLVATIENGAPGDICDTEVANAHQFAASGALYDALEILLAAVDKMDRRPSNGGGVLPVDKALATGSARAALALARGEKS